MRRDTVSPPVNDTGFDKSYFQLTTRIQKQIIDSDWKYINQLQVIAGIELAIIIVLTIFLIRKRRAKQ